MKFCPHCKEFVQVAIPPIYEEIDNSSGIFMTCTNCLHTFTECNQRLAQYDAYGIVMEID